MLKGSQYFEIHSKYVYTSEDLKWNASGVLDFNSLLISDP